MAKRTPPAQPSAPTGLEGASQSGTSPVAPSASDAPEEPSTAPDAGATPPTAEIAEPEGDQQAADVVGVIPAVGLIATLSNASRDAARAGDASLHAYLETVVIAAHALKLRVAEPRPDLVEPVASALDGLSTIL